MLAELKCRLSNPIHSIQSISIPPCPLLFLSQQERGEHLTGSSQAKTALHARSAVKDNSKRGRTKENGRGAERDQWRENKLAVLQGTFETYCKIIIGCNTLFHPGLCSETPSTSKERRLFYFLEINQWICQRSERVIFLLIRSDWWCGFQDY